MKKLRMILSLSACAFSLMAALAFTAPSVDTAWFAVDPNSGQTQQYLGSTQPICETQTGKFCAAEYPGVDSQGQPTGARIQLIEDAVRLQ
jgi:hypothetical protein